jgi:hypothetical protein
MLNFLAENYGTIIAALVVAGIVAASVITLIRNKKKGKSTCGCGCENCAMKGQCHSKGL